MGLEVAAPQARPRPQGQLGHAVGAEAHDGGGVARRQALDLGQPEHRAPALGQAPKSLGDEGPLLALLHPLGRAGGEGGGFEGGELRRRVEALAPAQGVDGGVAGGGQEVGAEGHARIEAAETQLAAVLGMFAGSMMAFEAQAFPISNLANQTSEVIQVRQAFAGRNCLRILCLISLRTCPIIH